MLELSSFLTLIKEELQQQMQSLQSRQLDRNELEDFILDLNSYYYQSFQERFFPLYRTEMEEEIKKLYKIARDESAIKEDILKNLKRSAQIYNHVKNGINVLEQKHALVDDLYFTTGLSQEQLLLELIYALKDMSATIVKSLDILTSCQSLITEQVLSKHLGNYPFQAMLANLWLCWEADSNNFDRDFKRLMINLELAQKLLTKISGSDEKSSDNWEMWLAELSKTENNLANKKYSPSLLKWYKLHVRPQFILYQELLELSIKQKDRKRIQLAVRNFAAWLQSLLYLLERVSRGSGIPEPMLLEMHWTKPVNYSFIKETTSFMMQIQKDLQNLIKQYEEASHPDFPIFSESAGKILSEAWPKFKSILQDHDATEYNILNNMLGHVKNQFSFLEMQIDHLNTRARHIEKMQQQYEQILTTIDNYHDLLAEMKSQLARSLAPRNLSRQFKDMDLRIEHIVLNKGEVFPSDYYALLNIENDPTGPERIIAEEDGDIFLFRLDDLKDALIPKIILEEG